MKFLNILKRSCILSFFCVLFAANAQAVVPEPVINAKSAILVEATTGRVLFEKNADEIRQPASMTKMMTCILALENGRMDEQIVISNLSTDTPYSELTLNTGEKLALHEILKGMMLFSDNAAATAVAENLAPTYQDFIQLMNKKAKELGLNYTHFSDPHGLTDEDHYSTAREMMKIARYGWTKAAFRDIVGQKTAIVEWSNPSWRQMYCENTNELLGEYPGMVGIKTGWTSKAGGCLASAAERGGLTLIAVVMGTENADLRFSDTRALMDYGFSLVRAVKGPVRERLGKKVVVHGSKKGHIFAYPAFDIVYPLKKGEKASKFTIRYEMPTYISAPVRRDQQVGELVILFNNREVGRMPMLAGEDVEPGFSLLAYAEGICDDIYSLLFC